MAYISSWEIFKENPLFGIGLMNFKNYSKINTHNLHVEFLIHLVELGIIGFIIYFNFIISIYKRIRKKIKYSNSKKPLILFFTFLSILFCGTVLFTFDSLYVSLIFGILILLTKYDAPKLI